MFRTGRIFAGTSCHETFGLLPVEARACGLPAVVRNNSSYPDTMVDGEGGYIVDNADHTDMARKIAAVLSLPATEWQNLANAAIASVARYTWPMSAQQHFEVYRRLLC